MDNFSNNVSCFAREGSLLASLRIFALVLALKKNNKCHGLFYEKSARHLLHQEQSNVKLLAKIILQQYQLFFVNQFSKKNAFREEDGCRETKNTKNHLDHFKELGNKERMAQALVNEEVKTIAQKVCIYLFNFFSGDVIIKANTYYISFISKCSLVNEENKYRDTESFEL
ncbi:hypothetical protein GLOIN_2v1474456 [Rhizophagus irregularis DAOM 181602=DAOM 197198]|nr:hypothetical protein GLOIN_2v1474456 [Rhizophagus irregularis DAOM 181602=DAOM 197198]